MLLYIVEMLSHSYSSLPHITETQNSHPWKVEPFPHPVKYPFFADDSKSVSETKGVSKSLLEQLFIRALATSSPPRVVGHALLQNNISFWPFTLLCWLVKLYPGQNKSYTTSFKHVLQLIFKVHTLRFFICEYLSVSKL